MKKDDLSAPSVIKEWFNRHYARRGLRSMRSPAAYPVFLKHLGVQKGKQLLDVGCGPGWLLQAAVRQGLLVRGMDFSREAIRLAHRTVPDAGLVVSDALHTPFKDQSFDYLTCIGVLEHFTEMEKTIAELRRITREDARFCIMVPNFRTFYWQLNRRINRDHRECNENALSLQEWQHLFELNGFRVLCIHRDEWQMRKALSFLFLNRWQPAVRMIGALVRRVIPLKYAHQFIFILKKSKIENQKSKIRNPQSAIRNPEVRNPQSEIRNPEVRNPKSEIRNLYDSLSRFVILLNRIKYREPYAGFTMHKVLRIPETLQRQYSLRTAPHYLNDLILEAAQLPGQPVVMDAGCGFGGTVFRWHQKMGGRYYGLTLSPVQLRVARREARRRGIDRDCRFCLASYDQYRPSESLDAVVAIEALIHSPDLPATLRHFSCLLKPGGKIIVADDFFTDGVDGERDRDAADLCRYWHLTRLPEAGIFRRFFRENGFELEAFEDLTDRVPILSRNTLRRMAGGYSVLRYILPFPPIRAVLSAQQGGVALQRLYQKGKVRYLLMVARKK